MLIIGLPHDPTPETYDHVLSVEGARPADQGSAQPASFVHHKERVALVPHTRLSWHRVRMPRVSKGQQRAALEGLLEEQWLQSPQSLHLSLHPIPEAAPDAPNAWVCACDAQWLRQVMQPLIQAGCMPQRLIPEFAPTPDAEVLHVLGPAEHPHVVWTRPQGVLAAPWPQPWPLLAATPVQVWAEVQDELPSRSESVRQGVTVSAARARIRYRGPASSATRTRSTTRSRCSRTTGRTRTASRARPPMTGAGTWGFGPCGAR